MHYSMLNQGRRMHDGSLALIDVNTFLSASLVGDYGSDIANVKRHGEARNALASDSLKVLQVTARARCNVFEQLTEAVKCNSLG
jgi:methylmalonyl-CoA mutase